MTACEGLILTKVIGRGAFGVVYDASVNGERVALKKVYQDKQFKYRELQIMSSLRHPNIVSLRDSFYSELGPDDEVPLSQSSPIDSSSPSHSCRSGGRWLNLVMEYLPETLASVLKKGRKDREPLSLFDVKRYAFQLFNGLAHMHAVGITHRDIKTTNLLVEPLSKTLKICDFGSAKKIIPSQPNVSYICSRFYRAPELIFGAVHYSSAVDIWSAGCVVAEMIIGQPLFAGDNGVDQLVEIIKILGTPSKEQLISMKAIHTEFSFPDVPPHPWSKVLGQRCSSDIQNFVSNVLKYEPKQRLAGYDALDHPLFSEMKQKSSFDRKIISKDSNCPILAL